MSINKDPFDLNGSSGNSRSYYDPATGKHITSGKGGPSSKLFWNSPNYERARERSNEFGGRSKWAALFKISLSDIKHLMHERCFNNIMAAGRLIQEKDENGTQGFRTISVNNFPEALSMIDFNESHPFRSIIRVNYEIIFSPDKKTITLKIKGFIPDKDARWVKKFNALKFYMVIAQVADMAFNPDTKIYQPVVVDLELLSKCMFSDWIVRNSLPVDITLEASFEMPAFTCPGTVAVVALGVEFSTSMVMNQPYVTPRSGSVAIVGCFTD
jgi:hypothetical protein